MKRFTESREERGLVGIIRTVDEDLQQQGFDFNSSSVKVDRSYLSDSVEPFDDFFEENSTALAVAQRRTSYTDLIRPIVSHYTAVQSRLFSPPLDPAFDNYTHDILSSMNQVGILTVDPTVFMTETRSRTISTQRKDTLLVSGAAGIGESIGAYLLRIDLSPFATNVFFPLVVITMFMGGLLYSQNDECRRDLKRLENAARVTDAYLKYVGEKYL